MATRKVCNASGIERKAKRTILDIGDHVRETMKSVNEVSTKTGPDKSKVPLRTIAVRINEVDYNRLNSLFTAQGTNLAQAGRAAIFHLAEQIEAGSLSIPNGVLYRNRG